MPCNRHSQQSLMGLGECIGCSMEGLLSTAMRLSTENNKLRALLHVNAMRANPGKSHAEINAAISAALSGDKDGLE